MTEQAQPQNGGPQAESLPAEVPVPPAEVSVPPAEVSVTPAEAPVTPDSATALGPAPSSPFPASLAGVTAALPADRPEVAIGGAFAGGLVLGLILKRLAR